MSVNYAALANTIKIEDITSTKLNREILHKLKNNDESFDKIFIMEYATGDNDDYIPDEGEDIGWLGYYIGQNTKLQELNFYITIDNESFYKEMSHNKSINKIYFHAADFFNGRIFRMMSPFFKSNNNLIEIEVDECDLSVEDSRQLSLAIGSCNKSMKHILITRNEMENGNSVDIITALSMHPQLETLELSWMDIGINECTVLSTLLRCTTTQLQILNFHGNNIDDDGIELLLPALRGHALQELKLGYNQSITIKGWKEVATVFETPDAKLKKLDVYNNNIGHEGALVFATALANNTTLKMLNIANNNMGDDGALVFANALANNSTLKTLSLTNCGITTEGWAHFSKLLCDTSSVNKTYLSNHTLVDVGLSSVINPVEVFNNLVLNSSEDKQQVAITKILQNHSHFVLEPFFEWEFKVLPIMIEWFTKATTSLDALFEEKINKKKLSTVYDFIKAFPMLYVESMTNQEIAKYTAMEEQLQGDKLKEIQKRKAHAMRRL